MKTLIVPLVFCTLIGCASSSNGTGEGTTDAGTATDAGPRRCGEWGLHRSTSNITFGYVSCEDAQTDTFGGGTSERSVAVGSVATLFIQSPHFAIDAVESSDDTVATFELMTATPSMNTTVKVEGHKEGEVTLVLRAQGEVVEEHRITVAPPNEIDLVGAPGGDEVAILSASSVSLCMATAESGRLLEGTGAIALSTEGDLQLVPAPTACGTLTPFATQGDGRILQVGATGGTLTATLGEITKTLHFAGIEAAAVQVSFDRSELRLTRATPAQLVIVKVAAGSTPLLNGCEMVSTPAGLEATLASTLESSGTYFYRIDASHAAVGDYTLTCNVGGGLVSQSMAVKVE